MFRIIAFCISFLFIGNLCGQSIGYGLSIGLPYSKQQTRFTNSDYNKSSEIGLVLAFKSNNNFLKQTELRLSTYSSQLKISDISNFNTLISVQKQRKFHIELQTFFLTINMKKLGNISLGSKLSYLFRSSIEGHFVLPNGQLDVIESFEYDRGPKLNTFISLRYSLKTINLGNGLKLFPTYTFDYSANNDFAQYYNVTKSSSHTIGLMIIKDLAPRSSI